MSDKDVEVSLSRDVVTHPRGKAEREKRRAGQHAVLKLTPKFRAHLRFIRTIRVTGEIMADKVQTEFQRGA